MMESDPVWKKLIKEGTSKVFGNVLALALPLIIAYGTGIWTRDFSGHSISLFDILAGAVITSLFLSIFLFINFLLKLPSVRYSLGRMRPFEGVWKETYSMTYPSSGITEFISIFSIRSGPLKDMQISGVVFNRNTGQRFSRFNGRVVDIAPDYHHLKYYYEVRFLNARKRTAEGFGFYDADFRSSDKKMVDSATGGFVELLESGPFEQIRETALEPHVDTKVVRVPFKQVRNRIRKYYPDGDSDYERLL
jgi:hypothetical protein